MASHALVHARPRHPQGLHRAATVASAYMLAQDLGEAGSQHVWCSPRQVQAAAGRAARCPPARQAHGAPHHARARSCASTCAPAPKSSATPRHTSSVRCPYSAFTCSSMRVAEGSVGTQGSQRALPGQAGGQQPWTSSRGQLVGLRAARTTAQQDCLAVQRYRGFSLQPA